MESVKILFGSIVAGSLVIVNKLIPMSNIKESIELHFFFLVRFHEMENLLAIFSFFQQSFVVTVINWAFEQRISVLSAHLKC